MRRSGTKFAATTLNGAAGRVMSFAFEQASPYIIEFTNGFMRFFAAATQTSGLTTPLPQDFRLVTTNDNQQVSSISTANPAVVQTGSAHGWATADQVQFLFATTVNAGFTPLLRARTFKITVIDTTHFSLADPITGATIDGSTLGWSAPAVNTVIVVRNLALATPYSSGTWASVRKVQAETQAIFLQGTKAPRNLSTVTLPTSTSFATFALNTVTFTDGPYLDPPVDGTAITPTTIPTQGILPITANWSAIAWNGTNLFAAVASGTAVAATSADGITWTQRTLPVSALWSGMAWNGAVFCAVSFASNIAVTSPDGIVWTQRTLPTSTVWSAIAWNGTVFCAVAGLLTFTTTSIAATSPDGIVWTQRALPATAGWSSIAWNGAVFCAIGYSSSIAATSADGITWTQRTLPTSSNWASIAWNGTVFCAIASGVDVTATSPTGTTWTQHTLPSVAGWAAIAWNGTLFCAISQTPNVDAVSADGITWTQHTMAASVNAFAIAAGGSTFVVVPNGSNISQVSTNGVFSVTTLNVSAISSVNNGRGFVSTDVGRLIRLLSEPLPWFVGTAYVVGNSIVFDGVYYTSIQNGTGKQPDLSPTFWTINTSAATWTWGIIASVVTTMSITISIQGPDLLYTNPILIWRLGVYSDTTGYPTCGTYYEGRIWLSGAVANRVDASVVNGILNNKIDMTPTDADGTVAGNNAISYTFNSDDVNPIFWMIGSAAGIVAGTQAGEWLISAPTTGPITPTNIQAHQGTHYGCANVEPEATQLTISFVQRFNRKVLEYFPDALSGRYTAPNLSELAKHLTASGIEEIRYQQELLPVVWARMGDGSIAGATYDRNSLFSSQPPKFIAWHRHDLGSERVIESIAVGPSADGTLDTLAMVTNDEDTGIRHVELMSSIFDVNAPITAGFLQDDAIVPSGATLVSAGVASTLTFYGLWHLNGETVAVSCGGVDVGDFTIASGSVTVPIDDQVNLLFITAYLQSISSTTDYGEMACPIDGVLGRLTVPAVIGFTYTSQGQILRPDTQDQMKSQVGPGLAKSRRIAQFGTLLAGTQGIRFGTDFSRMHAVQFKSPGGTQDLTALQLFDGVYWSPVDDTWGYNSMLCWDITRPYPACVVALDGFMQSTDT